ARASEYFRAAVTLYGTFDFDRKPPISLRLLMAGEPRAKLAVLPKWTKRAGKGGGIDPEGRTCEMLVEQRATVDGKEAVNWFTALRVIVGFPVPRNYRLRDAAENYRRALDTMRDFAQDARAVLARSSNNCCICGRGLTDEESRARGIGP